MNSIKEGFHFPFDSSWNTLDMYERRKIEDTPLTDPALRPQLFDNPLFTIPGMADTNYPDIKIVDKIPGDTGYLFPDDPLPFPVPTIVSTLFPKFPPPDDYPKPNFPTGDPSLPQGPNPNQVYKPKSHYNYEHIPIPAYYQYWPRMGTENTLPIPVIDTTKTDVFPTMLF